MIFYLLLIILFLLSFIHASIRYTRTGILIDKIPGPTPIPLFGNLIELNITTDKLWNLIRKNAIKYHPIAKIWLGTFALIITADPEDIKVALSSKVNIAKGYSYKYLKTFMKKGLITNTGENWFHKRTILNHAFRMKNLKQYIEIINRHVEKTILHIKSQELETAQSLVPLMKNLTLNIICEAAMNVDLDKIEAEKVNQYSHALDEYLEFVLYRTIRPYIRDWMLTFLKIGRLQKCNIKILHEFSDKVIQERRNHLDRYGYQSLHKFIATEDTMEIEDSIDANQDQLNFLDILLLAEKKGTMDAEAVQAEVHTFIGAGHDTTAVALVYLLMLLAENQEAQDLARAEVFEVLNESEGKITYTEIQKLNYLERCIKESLRLFSVVPHISRYISEEMQLKNYLVPAGHELGISIFDVHRNPEIWDDPHKFNPDRFLPENTKKRHPFAYIPFSAGLRNCIGQKFAMLELIIVAAHVLYNFNLEPIQKTADLRFKLNVVLTATHPVYVKFISLNRS